MCVKTPWNSVVSCSPEKIGVLEIKEILLSPEHEFSLKGTRIHDYILQIPLGLPPMFEFITHAISDRQCGTGSGHSDL